MKMLVQASTTLLLAGAFGGAALAQSAGEGEGIAISEDAAQVIARLKLADDLARYGEAAGDADALLLAARITQGQPGGTLAPTAPTKEGSKHTMSRKDASDPTLPSKQSIGGSVDATAALLAKKAAGLGASDALVAAVSGKTYQVAMTGVWTCVSRNSLGQQWFWQHPLHNVAYGNALELCRANTHWSQSCHIVGCH